uniref:Uncharacterized protein n=1 Tax=Oreochromis niloticus TaxID=8128 RepID=A0A669EEU4_ORENI
MDPKQDLLLATLSKNGICPNYIGPFTTKQSILIGSVGDGIHFKASATTFVLNQLNQQSANNPVKHAITIAMVANSVLRGPSTPSSTSILPSASKVLMKLKPPPDLLLPLLHK